MFQQVNVMDGESWFKVDLRSFAGLMQRNVKDVICDHCPLVEAQHNSFESKKVLVGVSTLLMLFFTTMAHTWSLA